MLAHMVSIVPHLTSACSVRHVRVSLPLVACLIDNERYFLPSDLPALAGHDLRPLFRPQPRPQHFDRRQGNRRDLAELEHLLGKA